MSNSPSGLIPGRRRRCGSVSLRSGRGRVSAVAVACAVTLPAAIAAGSGEDWRRDKGESGDRCEQTGSSFHNSSFEPPSRQDDSGL
ncbi:hypothetical protein BQ8482_20117 [Mesorhizobium delmotii]|uniref:Uncharacterized protein n=1 Tax=Mesorhizobium delmotii TaxID=1631247 RepID=A0A2P9AK28_9HYPH|nr:hypothetical protein BQ8482_20117 [Mesorhizobium delmotii]